MCIWSYSFYQLPAEVSESWVIARYSLAPAINHMLGILLPFCSYRMWKGWVKIQFRGVLVWATVSRQFSYVRIIKVTVHSGLASKAIPYWGETKNAALHQSHTSQGVLYVCAGRRTLSTGPHFQLPSFPGCPCSGTRIRLYTTYYTCRFFKNMRKALVGLKNSQSIYLVFCLLYWRVQVPFRESVWAWLLSVVRAFPLRSHSIYCFWIRIIRRSISSLSL